MARIVLEPFQDLHYLRSRYFDELLIIKVRKHKSFKLEQLYELKAPVKRCPGFWLRSPMATIMAKGKGQTRSWLIIAPLQTGAYVFKTGSK